MHRGFDSVIRRENIDLCDVNDKQKMIQFLPTKHAFRILKYTWRPDQHRVLAVRCAEGDGHSVVEKKLA
jgi:hypothetical protein